MIVDDDYVFDEGSGEWIGGDNPPGEVATADIAEARDSVGNRLSDGD